MKSRYEPNPAHENLTHVEFYTDFPAGIEYDTSFCFGFVRGVFEILDRAGC